MKKILAFAVLTAMTALYAENGMFSGFLPENWNADVVASIHYSHFNYRNWSDGGTNSSNFILRYNADIKGHWQYADWRNVANLEYGRTYTKGLGNRKTEDKIFLESMVDLNVFGVIKPYAGLRFESQFAKSYQYDDDLETPISCFMDPAYFTQVAGIAYVPNDNFSQRIGFANRMTFSEGYGFADDKDTEKFEKFRDEPGLESVTEFKYSLSDIVSYKTRLWAFVNFEGVEDIDGRWENTLSIALSPFIDFSFGLELFYDSDLDEDTQVKESLLFGLTWRWF